MPVTVSGPLTWNTGTLGAEGSPQVVTANGGLILGSGAYAKTLGSKLVNNSTSTWYYGEIDFSFLSAFTNSLTGTLDLLGDGQFTFSGAGLFVNAGLLRKSSGGGVTHLWTPFQNTGSVQVNTGTLDLDLADSTGNFAVAASSTLSLYAYGAATLATNSSITGPGNYTMANGVITNNGTFNLGGTSTFAGGTNVFGGYCAMTNSPVLINGGIVALNAQGVVAPNSLTLLSGALEGTMPVTVAGPFTWSSGTLGSPYSADPTPVLTANGGLSLSNYPKTLYATLINNSPCVWNGGIIYCYNTALFSNTPSGSLDVTTDGQPFTWEGGTPLFANAGALNKTFGFGTYIDLPFQNSGTVQTWSWLFFNHGFRQTTGQTVLNGGTLSSAQPLEFLGGTLSGTGYIDGSISNNAILSPGASPGQIDIEGDYSEGTNAHVQLELGGLVPGAGYDQVSVSGNATLAGTLDVSYWNGFVPSPGNVFTGLVCSACSGVFATVNTPAAGLSVSYQPGGVLITMTTNAPPPPPSLDIRAAQPNPSAGLLVLPLDGVGFAGERRLNRAKLVSVRGAALQRRHKLVRPGQSNPRQPVLPLVPSVVPGSGGKAINRRNRT